MPSQPAPSLIASTVEDLRHHAPFDVMDSAALKYLAARMSLAYFAKGEVLLAPEAGAVPHLFIVQKGMVNGAEANAAPGEESALSLSEGECFPIGALIAQRPSVLTFTAREDTFCYLLPLADFEHVMDISRPFRHFATRRIAALLEQSQRGVQSQYTSRVSDAHSLASPLKSIIRRAPVTVLPDTAIRSVLETMKSLRIGSVVVADVDQRPLGIFTERDVLDRIALAGIPQDSPIAQAMTPAPFTLPANAALFEAAQAMARYRFRHVLVMEEGRLIGVVSERDLFSLQRLSLGEIAKSIDQARDADALSHASREVRRLAAALLAQGVGAEQLTQFVTTLNDAIAGRALALAAAQAAPPSVPWCWMGLGSEGRMEQTLATDQDNALIFVPPPGTDAAQVRNLFLAFADHANRILDQCGFPLCKGNIMARNPKWCLTLEEWQETFGHWMRSANAEALLNAAIFFDFRPLHGDAGLAQSLRDWLSPHVAAQPLFLLQMANNALQVRPPLGLLRDFVKDDGDAGAYPGTIDLKKYGARPFIDAARIFALKHGVAASNTADRIRLAAPKMRMHEDEAAAIIDGFHFIQLLRLRNQEGGTPTAPAPLGGYHGDDEVPLHHPNRIDPDQLNELDRRILKEALRQARKLQSRLELDFKT
jgi:CBS domain-containing protein